MNRFGNSNRSTWLAAIVFVGWLFLPLSGAVFGQEAVPAARAAAQSTTAAGQATQPETTKAADKGADKAAGAEPATDKGDTDKDSGVPATQPSDAAQLPAGGTPAAGTGAGASAATGKSPLLIGAIVVALFVLPMLAGNYLARLWRMPDHGWKFSLTLGMFAASIVIVTFGEFKFGPDLAGGITLIYELADTAGKDVPMETLIDALKRRVDPTGTREVTIRQHGSAVEIIIPKTGQDELQYVKRQITEMGQLEFRITAEPARTDIQPTIAQANLLTSGQKDVVIGGTKKAEWVAYDEKEFGPADLADSRVVKRMAGGVPEALVLIDTWNVTGEYLTTVSEGVDETGRPAVHFSFNTRGAAHFGQLTGDNLPNAATNTMRYLGIVLDKKLISAPSIRSRISDNGQISGGAMSREEVQHIVRILKSGKLPAALNKTPISEEVISPTLGAVTVEHGKDAIAVSMVAVALFMLLYYRFAGLVACLALSFNLLLVLALMVLIKAAFTLPGLAGLALTVGMAVDANVLIYERIREELKSGAALRMAIRNGFNRALTAIVDSNVTNIITGLALYNLATESVKGFAVTLILGILTSMFTAIFFAHVVFDVVERRGWIKRLRMLQIMPNPNYDFLRVRYVAGAVSLAVIAIGLVAVVDRGRSLLDIDFTGGSSVTFTLKDESKMSIDDVYAALEGTSLEDKNLLVTERGNTGTRFTLDTSVQSVDEVKQVVNDVDVFGDKLMKFSVEVGPLTPFAEGDLKGFQADLTINSGIGYDENDGVSHDALTERVQTVLVAAGHTDVRPLLVSDLYQAGSVARYKNWTVRLPGLDAAQAEVVLGRVKADAEATPLFPVATTIGGRVSRDMQLNALYAIVISLLGVIVYLWVRFQKVSYGLAAAAAVVHDVTVTIGVLALSLYVVEAVPGLAAALKIDAFQISLTIVAALLTILGYSLNDTIVTFDRLREIKGKSPRLTAEMVNQSVNQCLGRTVLTSLTVFMVVVILYLFGGEGIHSFAFAFLVGIIAGTYSTIYIAAPILLWLSGTPSMTVEQGRPSAVDRVASAPSR